MKEVYSPSLSLAGDREYIKNEGVPVGDAKGIDKISEKYLGSLTRHMHSRASKISLFLFHWPASTKRPSVAFIMERP